MVLKLPREQPDVFPSKDFGYERASTNFEHAGCYIEGCQHELVLNIVVEIVLA
jgi:hypothetical protein